MNATQKTIQLSADPVTTQQILGMELASQTTALQADQAADAVRMAGEEIADELADEIKDLSTQLTDLRDDLKKTELTLFKRAQEDASANTPTSISKLITAWNALPGMDDDEKRKSAHLFIEVSLNYDAKTYSRTWTVTKGKKDPAASYNSYASTIYTYADSVPLPGLSPTHLSTRETLLTQIADLTTEMQETAIRRTTLLSDIEKRATMAARSIRLGDNLSAMVAGAKQALAPKYARKPKKVVNSK